MATAIIDARAAHTTFRRRRGGSVVKWRLMLTTLPLRGGGPGREDVPAVRAGICRVRGFFARRHRAHRPACSCSASCSPAPWPTTRKRRRSRPNSPPPSRRLRRSSSSRPPIIRASIPPGFRRGLLGMADTIKDWLLGRCPTEVVYEAMSGLNGLVQQLEREGAGPTRPGRYRRCWPCAGASRAST